MQDRLSAAAPRGSTARLLSRPKSAIAPGSPSAAVKTAGPKRPVALCCACLRLRLRLRLPECAARDRCQSAAVHMSWDHATL
eukprot:1600710-Rhodomonas_salina.1